MHNLKPFFIIYLLLFSFFIIQPTTIVASVGLIYEEEQPKPSSRLASINKVSDLKSADYNAGSRKKIKIAAGPIVSRYYLLATKLCYFFKQSNKNIDCEMVITNGGIDNIELLKNNQVDFAIAQSDTSVEAFNATEYYKNSPPLSNLRQVLNLYEEKFNIISKDEDLIKVFADIDGKRISYGNKATSTYLTYECVKELYPNIKPIEVELPQADFAKKLCNGEIDVLMITAGHPSYLINLIANSCHIEFVSIENDKLNKILEHNKSFKRAILKRNIYSGISKDQHTIGVNAILITNQCVDHTILSNFMNYFKKNIPSFKHTDQLLETMENNYFTTGFVLPQPENISY